ncbi:hypothetical protein HDU81_002537 [Chytriomyces hyalinus]|nr:hypothetical protein HDU81_002537 [Chytriomyces hyalinus]
METVVVAVAVAVGDVVEDVVEVVAVAVVGGAAAAAVVGVVAVVVVGVVAVAVVVVAVVFVVAAFVAAVAVVAMTAVDDLAADAVAEQVDALKILKDWLTELPWRQAQNLEPENNLNQAADWTALVTDFAVVARADFAVFLLVEAAVEVAAAAFAFEPIAVD